MSTVRVWVVEGPCVSEESDSVITDRCEDAGTFAAEAAENAWDASEGDPLKPGPAITIRCYEMPQEDYDALIADDEA